MSETSDSNRNASQLLHAARRAIRNIYKEAENVRVQIKNGGASDEVLNQTPFYCPCDPGQKALLQQAMSELRDLLTMHQDRRKGESEQRLNRALINIGDLYRAEQLENSLAKALEQTRKVLNRRCEYLIAEKKGKGSLEIHKMIQDLHQIGDSLGMDLSTFESEKDESLSVVLAHTTSEEDNFFFAAEITLLCVDPEEGKTRNLLKDAPESELKVVEAKMTSYMGGEDEVTCADSDKDLENTLRKRSLDVLRHKLSLCIENQRFLFENKDHESGGKTLPNEGSIVFDRMQQHRASHPKQILKVHRFLEGPSMCIMPAAPLQPIYLRQNVGGGYYGTYLRSVCDELSLVFIRSAPPAPPKTTTGGGDRSSSSGGSQFGYAFEIRPAILTSLPAGMEISTMAGVSHVQYHAILFNDQNHHTPAAGFSRAATAAKTTTTTPRRRRTTTATASASSTSAMNVDDSSGGGYSVNGASSSPPPAYPGLHEILGFRGQGERKYDLFGQTQVWKLRNRTPQRQANSNQESKISRAGGGNLMALGIDRIYVRSMDDVFALIPMLQREMRFNRLLSSCCLGPLPSKRTKFPMRAASAATESFDVDVDAASRTIIVTTPSVLAPSGGVGGSPSAMEVTPRPAPSSSTPATSSSSPSSLSPSSATASAKSVAMKATVKLGGVLQVDIIVNGKMHTTTTTTTTPSATTGSSISSYAESLLHSSESVPVAMVYLMRRIRSSIAADAK